MRLAIAICALAAATAQAQPKRPKPPPPSAQKVRADKLFEDGRRYLAAREFALACTAFEQSQQADPAIGTVLNIALCYEEWGKLAAAHRAYIEAEKLAQAKADDRERGARLKIDELAPKVPRLIVTIPADADPAIEYVLDGKDIARDALAKELLLESGKHVVEARMTGRPTKTSEIVLELGKTKTLAIDVPRPEAKVLVRQRPRKQGRLYGGLAIGTVGLAAIGVASLVAFGARSDYADAIVDCPAGVCETREAFDATQDARSRANRMTYVGAGGAVLVGAGLFLILTSKGDRYEEKVTLSPVIGPDGVGVSFGGKL